MTVGQRWRRKRNLTLFTARRGGVPLLILANVFDLSPRQVGRIVDRLRAESETGRPGIPQLPTGAVDRHRRTAEKAGNRAQTG
jgi:hypothetical protein